MVRSYANNFTFATEFWKNSEVLRRDMCVSVE
jgi:hypothetical protein